MTFGQRSFVVIYFKVTVLKNSLVINSLAVSSPASKRELHVNLFQAVRVGPRPGEPQPACAMRLQGRLGQPGRQNSSIFLCRYLSMESMPWAEPQIFFSTSHSRSLACSSSSFMLQRTRALDSSSTCARQGAVVSGDCGCKGWLLAAPELMEAVSKPEEPPGKKVTKQTSYNMCQA